MNIYGIGIDIVKISRLEKLFKKKDYLKRIFSKKEIQKCSKKKITFYSCFAKRFAAKEAFSKALGTGISKGLNFNEIEIDNEKNGKPFIRLKDTNSKKIKFLLKNKYKLNLTISDEKEYAVAMVLISK